jgi:hypothetical protein
VIEFVFSARDEEAPAKYRDGCFRKTTEEEEELPATRRTHAVTKRATTETETHRPVVDGADFTSTTSGTFCSWSGKSLLMAP